MELESTSRLPLSWPVSRACGPCAHLLTASTTGKPLNVLDNSLRSSHSHNACRYLVVSFISETRVLVAPSADELEETSLPGFEAHKQTLHCSNVAHNQLIQVRSCLSILNYIAFLTYVIY